LSSRSARTRVSRSAAPSSALRCAFFESSSGIASRKQQIIYIYIYIYNNHAHADMAVAGSSCLFVEAKVTRTD
jgi:hypothetical protein